MKHLFSVKEQDLHDQARTVLLEILRQVPTLDVREEDSPQPCHGLKLRVSPPRGRPWFLHGEIKTNAYPKQIRNAILHVSASAGGRGNRHYPILIAPYISKEATRICQDGGVGCLDLSGNCHISFGNIHIHVEGKPNRFKEERPLRSVFAPKSSRLLRVLLQGPLVPRKTTQLADAANVSLGLVSKLRTRLLDLEWARESGEGVKITRPDAVLDAWSREDRWEKRTTVREYSLLTTDPHEIARRIHEYLGKTRHAFTQWFAAHLRHPYTAPPIVSLYVSRFPEESLLKSVLGARRVDSGGRLRLVLPDDEGVFLCCRETDGFPLVCDVQIYLDTLRAGQRGEEAARELRNWPDFCGGWS